MIVQVSRGPAQDVALRSRPVPGMDVGWPQGAEAPQAPSLEGSAAHCAKPHKLCCRPIFWDDSEINRGRGPRGKQLVLVSSCVRCSKGATVRPKGEVFAVVDVGEGVLEDGRPRAFSDSALRRSREAMPMSIQGEKIGRVDVT